MIKVILFQGRIPKIQIIPKNNKFKNSSVYCYCFVNSVQKFPNLLLEWVKHPVPMTIHMPQCKHIQHIQHSLIEYQVNLLNTIDKIIIKKFVKNLLVIFGRDVEKISEICIGSRIQRAPTSQY